MTLEIRKYPGTQIKLQQTDWVDLMIGMHIYTLLVSWDIYGIIRNFIFASKNIWDLFQVLQINNMLVLVY